MTSNRPIDSGTPAESETPQRAADLAKRPEAAAKRILMERDPFGSESIDHAFIERLLAEAYRRGWWDAGGTE